MMLGMTSIRFRISFVISSSWRSISSSSPAMAWTRFFTSWASSFFPWPMSLPISLLIWLRCCRSSSPRALEARNFSSKARTSSTKGSFSSWNFFLMFSFTSSGLERTNFISSILFITLLARWGDSFLYSKCRSWSRFCRSSSP